MIIKGNLHAHAAKLADYLTKGKNGERAELAEVRGFVSDDVREALLGVDIEAGETRCENPFFHAYMRLAEGEHLTRTQWFYCIDQYEKALGFEGQSRIVSFHIDEKTGEEHPHIAWSRINTDNDKFFSIDPGLFIVKGIDLARELEVTFDLKRLSSERNLDNKTHTADQHEFREAQNLGTNLRAIRETIRDCLDRSDNGQSFKVALEQEGLKLAKGDRRDFVVIDQEGGHHGLNKKLTGLTAHQLRGRLSDLDPTQLPSVEQARAEQLARSLAQVERTLEQTRAFTAAAARATEPSSPIFDRDAYHTSWEEKIAQAAIAKEENARQQRQQPEAERGTLAGGSQPDSSKPLGKTASAMREAAGGADFAQGLKERGLILVYIGAEEARASERAQAFAKAVERQNRALKEGFAVVDERGNVYGINKRTTGEHSQKVLKELAGTDRNTLLTVSAAREAMKERRQAAWAEQQQAARESARAPSFMEAGIAECAEQARRYGAVIERDDKGRRIFGAEALAARLVIERDEEGRRLFGAEALDARLDRNGDHGIKSATVYGAEAFAARLGQVGISLARVTAEDVKALDDLRMEAELAAMVARTEAVTNSDKNARHFAELEAGELAAVTRNGNVYRINPDKLGGAEIPAELPSVTEARKAFQTDREKTDEIWAGLRTETNADRETYAEEREERVETAHSKREERQTLNEIGVALDAGFKTARKVAEGVVKAVETVISFFDWTGGKKTTRQQRHDQARARGNEETLHADAVAAHTQTQEEARAQQQHEQKSDRQERDAEIYRRFGHILIGEPDRPKEIELGGGGREREREE